MSFQPKPKRQVVKRIGSKNKHRWKSARRWLSKCLTGLFVTTGSIMLIGGGIFGYGALTAPKLTKNIEFKHPPTIVLTNDANQPFYQSRNVKYSSITNLNETNGNVINAVLSIEDRNFYHETGANYSRMIIAGVHDMEFWKRNDSILGGSTITQQLVKLTYFSTKNTDRNIKRKVQELYLAEKINHKYSKDYILRNYLNAVYMGNNVFGFKSAAEFYFNKPLNKLSLNEAATLAGMIQAPNAYDPYQYFKTCLKRRNTVLLAMYQNNKISKTTMLRLIKKPLNVVSNQDHQQQAKTDNQRQNGYTDYAGATLTQLQTADPALNINRVTMTIHTPMQQDVQDKLNQIVRSGDIKFPNDDLQVAVTVLDNKNGNVVATLSNRQATNVLGFNRATMMQRSTGSAIKPILDYAPFYELKGGSTEDTIDDRPYQYVGTHTWLHNWDDKYTGTITMRKALTESRNIPAAKLLAEIGLKNGSKVLNASGLHQHRMFYSNAIGVNASPTQIASAYSALANNGLRSNAKFVNQINVNYHKLVCNTASEQVFSPQSAFLVSSILKDTFTGNGTATNAKLDQVQAGKTGSTGQKDNALTDAWMVGYNKQYTIVVWTGYDDSRNDHHLKMEDEQISQQIYKELAEYLWLRPGTDQSDFDKPNNVTIDHRGYKMDAVSSDNNFLSIGKQTSFAPFKTNQNILSFFGKAD